MKLKRSFYSFRSGVFFDFANARDLGHFSTEGSFLIYHLSTYITSINNLKNY